MAFIANPTIYELTKELGMVASFHSNPFSKKKAALNAEWLQELLSYKDETLITTEWLQKYFKSYSENEEGWTQMKKTLKKHCIYICEIAEHRWQVHVETDEKREEFDLQTLGQLRMFLTLFGVPREFIKKLE